MRKLFLTLWCLLPLGGAAYHYGPGRARLVLDEAAGAVDEARAHVRSAQGLQGTEAAVEWALASARFEEALRLLPKERDTERRALTLERAKCRMLCSELPQANAELRALVQELEQEPGLSADSPADAALLFDARRTWANSEFYMTWLLRLEGALEDEWEPRIEAARQVYKLLAEEPGTSAETRKGVQEDLESAVRLARMDLGELQGLPLPSQ
jgi:hypothetical protein